MRRMMCVLLVIALLVGCTPVQREYSVDDTNSQTQYVIQEDPLEALNIDDAVLHGYIEDNVYVDLVTELDDVYFVENVQVSYISKEYLEEVQYNSQENIYFGYTLSELDAVFQGTRYVFTLGDDGQTTVAEFEEYEDIYSQMLRNVAIGAGIILLCVTVSTVSGGMGAPAVSMIFAASAKSGTIIGLSSGLFSGVAA